MSLVMSVMRRCAQGAKNALDSLPKIWPPDAPGASAVALGQIKICGDGVSLKVQIQHLCLLLWQRMPRSHVAYLQSYAPAPHFADAVQVLCACSAFSSLFMGHEQGLGLTRHTRHTMKHDKSSRCT